MSIIDISVPLYRDMPVWPGSAGFRLEQTMSLKNGGEANVSAIHSDIHMGTHLEAPLHFVEGGESIDLIPLNVLCGRVFVAGLSDVNEITEKDLSSLHLPEATERVLFKTGNSKLWEKSGFIPDYAALTEDAARWVVRKGIRLVGIDYLSIQRYHGAPDVHRILLEAGVIILEGLNLEVVGQGQYELFCLPLKIMGAEGAPARAVLKPLKPEGSYGQ